MTLEIDGGVDDQGIHCLKSLISDGLFESAWYGQETPSTNTCAVADLRCGTTKPEELPRIYLADNQTAGRGRQGRTWVSDEQNLAFSMVLYEEPLHPFNVGWQSIAVGVAIAEAIEHEFSPIKTKLKWPNDIWIDGGKFGGVLIERVSTMPDCIVVGVGLNIAAAPTREEIENAVPAKSLASCLGRPVVKWQVLDAIVRRIMAVQNDLKNDPSLILSSFRQRCLLTGNEISFQSGGETKTGICEGIGHSGELMVKQGDKVRAITSGEASLIRVSK